MADPMTRLTKATMDLKKFTNIFNYWTFLLLIVLFSILIASILFSLVFQEPWLSLATGLSLFFIIIAFVMVLFVKDTQKQIMLTVIRAILGALLPLTLLLTLGPLSLWLKILSIALFLIGLVIFYLIFKPINTMTKITKELVKSMKS